MANLSLRMRDDLKRKAQELAKRQGVSLNNFINSTIAASVAQEETLRFFDERLRDVDLETLHNRVLGFMSKTKPGDGPAIDELRQAMGSS
jgi:antitoxin component of RelBE/YafQ-DinJ toxin-antitoxin module